MSKKFKGEMCVYCGSSIAQTADHVLAREFFLPARRHNLPQVPACNKCNNEKSRLEHYLTAVLPFGGRHKDALTNLESAVPKRLAKNKKLHGKLANQNFRIWTQQDNGLLMKTTAIPIDSDCLLALIEYIVRGLTWYHWRVMLTNDHFIKVAALTAFGERFLQERFFQRSGIRSVSKDWGEGSFYYEGVQDYAHRAKTAWRLSIYGGVTFAGDPDMPSETTSQFGAITGEKRGQQNVAPSEQEAGSKPPPSTGMA